MSVTDDSCSWLVAATRTPVWTTGWSRLWRGMPTHDALLQVSKSDARDRTRHHAPDLGASHVILCQRFALARRGRHCRSSGTADPIANHRLRPEEMGGGCDQRRAPGSWRRDSRGDGRPVGGKLHHANATV